MHNPIFPNSPLAVVHTTMVFSTLASTMLLLALVFALLDPVWSRAALALQAMTLAVMGLARRWGPSRRIAIYALLLVGVTLIWDPTLPPADVAEEHVRALLALAVSVVVLADLLPQPLDARSFRPARVEVYAGLVDLTEAACFFRRDPDRRGGGRGRCRAADRCAAGSAALITTGAQSGEAGAVL